MPSHEIVQQRLNGARHVAKEVAHCMFQHGQLAVNQTKEQLAIVGEHLQSKNPTERAVGAVGGVVAAAGALGVTAIGLDLMRFVVNGALTVVTLGAVTGAPDNKDDDPSYWNAYSRWLVPMLAVGGFAAAFTAVKSRQAASQVARCMSSFFPEHNVAPLMQTQTVVNEQDRYRKKDF